MFTYRILLVPILLVYQCSAYSVMTNEQRVFELNRKLFNRYGLDIEYAQENDHVPNPKLEEDVNDQSLYDDDSDQFLDNYFEPREQRAPKYITTKCYEVIVEKKLKNMRPNIIFEVMCLPEGENNRGYIIAKSCMSVTGSLKIVKLKDSTNHCTEDEHHEEIIINKGCSKQL